MHTPDFKSGFICGLDAAVSAAEATTRELIDETTSKVEKEFIDKLSAGLVKGFREAIRLIKDVDL